MRITHFFVFLDLMFRVQLTVIFVNFIVVKFVLTYLLVLSEQAVVEELRRESAERQRTLQEEIERLKIEKEEVTVDNSPS